MMRIYRLNSKLVFITIFFTGAAFIFFLISYSQPKMDYQASYGAPRPSPSENQKIPLQNFKNYKRSVDSYLLK